MARKPAGAAPSAVLQSPGQALDASARSFLEPRFGHDFSRIRVHTGPRAEASARALQARAYTVGDDIAFGAGQYQPGEERGRRLLAHELSHSLQQHAGAPPHVQRKVEVEPGVNLDTQGYNVTKVGNVYSAPSVVKASIWNEIFTGLFASSWVFKLLGATDATASTNLKKHMAARNGVVEFSKNKRYTFASGTASKANPKFWDPAPGTGPGFKPKPGVTEEEASKDLNVNPEEYAIACEMATRATLVGGGGSTTEVRPLGAGRGDWIPGDAGYIWNREPGPKDPSLGGENVIYVGKDQFWGHMSGVTTTKTMVEWLKLVTSWGSLLKSPGTTAPEIDENVEFPGAGLDTGGATALPSVKKGTTPP